jgi:hypothetical protein
VFVQYSPNNSGDDAAGCHLSVGKAAVEIREALSVSELWNRSMTLQPIGIALGEESVPAGEETAIDQIVAIHRYVQEFSDRRHKPVPRGQHPKGHGCVRADFIVEPDLPEALRYGVFREPRTYPALIRFSNGRQWDDTKPDVHEMAVKLLEVEGEKLLESEKEAQTQDFVMIDHPVFFVRNVADYVPFMEDFRRFETGGILSKTGTGLKFLLSPFPQFHLLRAVGSKKPDSPLGIQYWSTTPFNLGPHAIKFSARPDLAGVPPAPVLGSKDQLREAMSAHLRQREARFDFLVQLQTDPAAMPVEDATVLWDENASPFRKAASICIPTQSFDSKDQMQFCENLTFTPWHALPEHRPLGGINRTRKKVYEAISRRRHELNGTVMQELMG